MHQATYEVLPDGTFYGEIPGFPGVYANAETLEGCCDQLREVLEGWIVLGLREQGRATPRPVQGFLWERGALGEVFRLSMGVTVFFGLGAGTIFVFLPTFAESLGVQTLALFYTAYALAAIGVRVFGGRLIDTRGRRAVIVPSMLMQAVATALLAITAFLVARTSQTPVVPVLFLAGLLAGGAHGFLYPGLAALVTDQTPAGRRGVVVGIFSSVFLTGQTAGALVFGYVTHSVGYAFMWTILTSLLFAGFALSLRLERACPTSGGATPLPPVTRGGLARERIARAKPARDRGESDTRRGGSRAPRADDVILSEVAGETGWRE